MTVKEPKRTVLVAAFLFSLLVGKVNAEDRLPFYAGFDLVQLTTKVDDKTGVAPDVSGSSKSSTFRLIGGAHVNAWLDAEFRYDFPVGGNFSTSGSTNNTVKTRVLSVLGKPKLSFKPVELYGLIGASSVTTEVDGTKIFPAHSNTGTVSGFSYGAGAQFAFSQNIAATFEWVQYSKGTVDVSNSAGNLEVSARAIGAGIRYTF
ncbi:MAG: porin family protein [Betaproteobacteria bacterium]|nr:porin family protein [Betaproteobacteria bacterium]